MLIVSTTSCVVPFPLEAEPPETKDSPRFLREYNVPQFKADVKIDSNDDLILHFVVEDKNVYDDIPGRIFKDYALAPDSQKLRTIVAFINIAGSDPNIVPEEEAPVVREFEFAIQSKLLCSSEQGDISGSTHYIEVVIANAFDPSSEVYPKFRATVGPEDVWSFLVVCVQTN